MRLRASNKTGRGRHFARAWTRSSVVVTATLAALICFSTSAKAAGFLREVTNTNDSGTGSLRQAILDAEVSNTNDTIVFIGVSGAITLTSGFLEISSSMTINGPGANVLAVNGGNSSTVFLIDSVNVSISGLTIRNGNAMSGNGGGIDNFGALTLTNCWINGNSGTDGGGIFSANTASLTVNSSTISGNSATTAGSGIYTAGPATVTNSTISGNGTGSEGAGIDNHSTLIVNNCTISGNSTSAVGGGGAIANNAAATFKNTIVANSLSGNCANGASATFNSEGHNLSDDTTCDSLFNGTGDMNNTPAGLDTKGLQDNGGPTRTIALLPTSLAVDAVPTSPTNYCTKADVGMTPITSDQRGVSRPDPEDSGAACDIGAFELVAATPTATATATASATATPTTTATITATATLTATSTTTPHATATATVTATATKTPTATGTTTPTATATSTASSTATQSSMATRTATPTATATATPTSTATASASPTQTATPSATATTTSSKTATTTPTATSTSTAPATATATETATPTITATKTATATSTATSSRTATSTATASATTTPTATATPGGGRISVRPKKLSLSAAPAASATGNITITNTGKGPLNGNVTLPNHHPPFSEMGGGAFSIGPGGHEDVTIVYSPATKGSTSDQIMITSDDPTHKKATKIKLKGKAR